MKDELRKYVETRIGFSISDEFYYQCIEQLSLESSNSRIIIELNEYLDDHNYLVLNDDTICYVKNRIKLFKDMLTSTYFPSYHDIDYHTVKEISIISEHSDYEDLLRMSANWISYKKQIDNKEEDWSYKTQSKDFFNKYEQMIETFNHLQHCPPEFEYNEDEYKITIRVTFNDDTYLTFYRTSSFESNSMRQQAAAIIKLIPIYEEIPVYLKMPVY